MTLLVFKGKGNRLTCVPPNQIDTTGKTIALIYFSEPKPKLLVTGNFVYETPFDSGTKRVIGVTNHTGPPFYVPLKPNISSFELNLAKLGDATPATINKDLLAILKIADE